MGKDTSISIDSPRKKAAWAALKRNGGKRREEGDGRRETEKRTH
jgi:hypothetical protein